MEVPLSQLHSLDKDGDLIITRRNVINNHADYSNQPHAEDTSKTNFSLDEDGDLVLVRRNNNYQRCRHYELTIQHSITSSIPSVGLQVWRAALVLADFVLHKSFTSSEFIGFTALELGAGTDIGVEVLDNCAANVRLNSNLLKFHETAVRVRELDWKDSWPPSMGTSNSSSQQRTRYSWASSEIEEAERATLLLAADVIYSDELTDSFFSILERLMSRGSEKVLYLALEKRYNFTLDDLHIVANGYAHFRSFLKDEEECTNFDKTSVPCFMGKQMSLDQIPQFIKEYERGEDLEIWKITYCSRKTLN